MSLVSEALRKARQEAAEKRAQQRGVIYTGTIVTSSSGSRLGLGLVIGSIIAAVAALGGGAAVWWTISRTDPTAQSEESPTGPTPAAESAVAALPAPPPASEPIREPETVPEAVPSPAQASPAPQPELVAVATPAPIQPTPAPQLDDTAASEKVEPVRVYVVEADLGYARLSLGFLVFRSEDPFAEINGTEVREGQSIDGFVVEKIERTQVTLRDDQGPLVLKVK
jgi:hypothetical protein